MNDFTHHEMVPLGTDETTYRKLTADHVSEIGAGGRRILKVEPAAPDDPQVVDPPAAESTRAVVDEDRPGVLAHHVPSEGVARRLDEEVAFAHALSTLAPSRCPTKVRQLLGRAWHPRSLARVEVIHAALVPGPARLIPAL